MAATHPREQEGEILYRESDGRPIRETPIHRRNILHTIHMLEAWYAADRPGNVRRWPGSVRPTRAGRRRPKLSAYAKNWMR
jgi:hypothetical protein